MQERPAELQIPSEKRTVTKVVASRVGRVPHVRLSVRGPKMAFFKCFP
jgi:hypothetical protein